MNRQQRRMAQSVHKKEVKHSLSKNDWGQWIDITNDFMMKMGERPQSFRMKKYLKNNVYTAQIIETTDGHGLLLGIRRHDQSSDIPWSHKQRIKNEVIGEAFQAIEIFPPQKELVDDANMFWLWSFDWPIQGCNLSHELKGIYSNQ